MVYLRGMNHISNPVLYLPETMCTFALLIGGSVVATIWLDKMSGAPGLQTFFPVIFHVRSRTAKTL